MGSRVREEVLVASVLLHDPVDEGVDGTGLRSVRPQPHLSAEEIQRVLRELQDPVRALWAAPPEKKAELYIDFGLSLTYQPLDRRVFVEADLAWGDDRVGGGI